MDTPWYRSLLVFDPRSGARSTLAEGSREGPFLGLNDLVFADDGTLYFTDPGESGLDNPNGRVFRWREGSEPEITVEYTSRAARIVGDVIDAAGMSQANVAVDADGHSYVEWAQSFTLGYRPVRELRTYVEWYVLSPTGAIAPGVTAQHYLDAGLVYWLTPDETDRTLPSPIATCKPPASKPCGCGSLAVRAVAPNWGEPP